VQHVRGDKRRWLLVATIVFSALDSTACADAITSSYTVTNLGSGTITLLASNGNSVPVDRTSVSYGTFASALSNAANGGQIMSVSSGQVSYPFAFMPDAALTPYQGNLSNFPSAVSAPVSNPLTYGNPLNAYSIVFNPLANANGTVVAIDSAGVFGHLGASSVYYVQRSPDGSWGTPNVIWSGNVRNDQGPSLGGVTIAGINNMNQVLGTIGVDSAYSLKNAVMYDINTHTLTNLSTLPALAGFLNILPVAIDDLGRILVEASPFPPGTEETLLLTPSGVNSDPLAVPAPEPGSLVVMALAMAAIAIKRAWGRPRG
jgi:hypothetical protein